MLGRALLICLLSFGLTLGQTSDEYLRQAGRLIQDFQWLEAERLLRRATEEFPAHPGLSRKLARVLLQTGRIEAAVMLLEQALALDPENREVRFELAEAVMRAGRLEEAVLLYESTLAEATPSRRGEVYHRLATAHFLRAQDPEALALAEQAVTADPINPEFRRFYAGLLEFSGDLDNALKQLEAAYQIKPRDAAILTQLASLNNRLGRPTEALRYLEAARELDPESPVLRDRLADLYVRLGRVEEARQEQARANQLRVAFDVYLRAIEANRYGDASGAASILREQVDLNPDFVTGRLFLAELHRSSGEHDAALEVYLQILERDPNQLTAIEGGAWMRAQKGALDEALELLRRLARESPNQALLEGYRELVRQNWEEALSSFQTAERDQPLNPELLRLISFTYRLQGDFARAREYLEKADRMRPGDADLGRERKGLKVDEAFKLLQWGRWDAAISAFETLLREESLEPDTLLYLAYSRQNAGDLEGAVRDYRSGLAGKPDAEWARLNLAVCLYQLGRFHEAVPEWRRLASTSSQPDSFLQLGLTLSHLERFEEADEAFQEALRLGPETPELLFNLGVLRLRQERSIEAMSLLRRSAQAGYAPAQRLIRHARR